MDIYKEYPRRFLDTDADLGDPKEIRAAYASLAEMPVDTKEQADAWSAAWDEVNSAISQVIAKAYFETTKDTRDEKAEAEFKRIADEVIPLAQDLDEKAKRRFLSFPAEWVPDELGIARTNAEWAVELFRENNLPLITKNINLENEYYKITGAWETEFEGEMLTPQQLKPYLESPDRAVREKAWRAQQGMHLADYDKLNGLFDRLMTVRKELATNADMFDYADYQYRNYARLSYGREDAKRFREAVLDNVVPAVEKIYERRVKKLGLDTVRPWDLNADADGKAPPKIYEDIADLKEKVERILRSVDHEFGDAFRLMDEKGYLDLENRSGKAPGAYMNEFAEERLPLIFANSVGTSRDMDTLVHEGGHAMHGFLSRHLPYHAREIPTEYAEVASMSLELLARPYLDIVYNEDDRERIALRQLEATLTFLPFMAMLDAFQDWVYTNAKGDDSEARADYWRELETLYRPFIDYGGLDAERDLGWQYNHVFTVPLYYIEYGIAQVGALQVFMRSLADYDSAVLDYKRSLSLGATAGLPELFEAAGVKFVLKHPEVLRDAVDRMKDLIEI
ncbi:MAG: M3 family oligoendopeptidase [bacterium]|nr:M3 family oligoendopeptidase [bacterium]